VKTPPLDECIWSISDEDLWSSIRLLRGREGTQHLAAAVRLGKAGRRERAYAELVAWHRVSLAPEWERIRPAAQKAALPAAQALSDLLKHKITCWHHQVVQFGKKIDWGTDRLARDSLHGFHYFGWFHPAINAFVQTGEERYRQFLMDIVTQYYFDARRDPQWNATIRNVVYSVLGIAGKLPAILGAYLALIHTGELPTRTAEAFAKLFLSFGRALDVQLGRFVVSNHHAAGCNAALRLARLFPEFRESAGWDRTAVRGFYRQITDGFYPDGFHKERVWGYGYFTLSSIATAYQTAQNYGGLGRYDRPFLKAIRRGYRYYAATLGPKYMMPSNGDCAPPHDASNLLKAGQRFFPKGTDLNLGVDRTRSYCFRDSGFAVLRSGDEPTSSYVNINFGEFGGWHSHQDLLSMNFWSQGVPLLEEVSRFGPYCNPLDVWFRAPEAHNLLLIDGMVCNCHKVRGEDVAWFSSEQVDYFSAYHRAYHYFVFGPEDRISPNINAKVRRTVVMVKDPGYVLVLDSVTDMSAPDFGRAITQMWHSPGQFQILGRDRARTAGREACFLVFPRREGLIKLEPGVDFLKTESAHLGASYDRYNLRARRWMPLAHHGISGFTTLLYPFTGRMPEVSVQPLPCEGGGLWKTEAIQIAAPGRKDTIILNPERVKGFRAAGQRVACRARIKLGDRRETIVIP